LVKHIANTFKARNIDPRIEWCKLCSS